MKRSKHSLSHYRLLTCDMGELVPIGLVEVLPGDTVQQATSVLIRCSPLMAPVMHPVHVRVHHWFVPHRLVWSDWENFITGGPDGQDASVLPYINWTGGVSEGSLGDYLGLPTGVNIGYPSALPFRAYQLIFNEWYRDEDLVTAATISKASGADTTTTTTLQNVGWEKDYFTSARPWTQKGDEVTVPLGTSADVVVKSGTNPFLVRDAATGNLITTAQAIMRTINSNTGELQADNTNAILDPNDRLEADLSSATAVSVNQLRQLFALQRYEEARARFGSRYTEYLRYLGVRSSDARLQRPEYLGGGKQTIQFSEVLQTGGTSAGADTGVGNMKGHGIGAMRSNRYRRFFEEHGYIMTLLSVKPKTMYCQGIPRTWIRATKEDFFQKELQHIGQQLVQKREIYNPASAPVDGMFGYQDRYDEYRRCESGISGEFRSTLDHWHMGRIFSGEPALNGTFVKSEPTKRIFASEGTDGLWIMANHSIQARRLVAANATPIIV